MDNRNRPTIREMLQSCCTPGTMLASRTAYAQVRVTESPILPQAVKVYLLIPGLEQLETVAIDCLSSHPHTLKAPHLLQSYVQTVKLLSCPPFKMVKIFLLLLATIAAAFASQHESFHHVSERALPDNIAADLSTISKDLQSLTATVKAYEKFLDGVAIGQSENAVIKDLDSATANADRLNGLPDSDSQDIIDAVKGLMPDIEDVLGAIADKEPQFRANSVDGRVVAHVKKLQSKVQKYGDSLLAHVAGRRLEQGKELLAEIMDIFARTIAQFQ
ncbi:hypothetical protein Q7P36_004105 [Cladosporium allicinum]